MDVAGRAAGWQAVMLLDAAVHELDVYLKTFTSLVI
jgi:hypothetical protein